MNLILCLLKSVEQECSRKETRRVASSVSSGLSRTISALVRRHGPSRGRDHSRGTSRSRGDNGLRSTRQALRDPLTSDGKPGLRFPSVSLLPFDRDAIVRLKAARDQLSDNEGASPSVRVTLYRATSLLRIDSGFYAFTENTSARSVLEIYRNFTLCTRKFSTGSIRHFPMRCARYSSK